MTYRYSAARPKRASEVFARQHHGEQSDDEAGVGSSKKVKFDVRNPSALAPDAREEDDILEADVIGVGAAATKRGAVNIDGYDSDSENETFNARAEQRNKTGKGNKFDTEVNLIDQLDNYDSRLKEGDEGDGGNGDGGDDDDDDDDDMFGENDKNDKEDSDGPGKTDGKKGKEVRFLDASKIEGQDYTSRSGGHVRLDDKSSSDDEDITQEILEEGIDEEVGPGGLKKHAPKIEAFNMRQEQEDGAFDEAGNYIRKAIDPDAVHDSWLEGVSKKQMKKAAMAQQQRDADLRQQRRDNDSILVSDLFATLITRLELGETPLEALARLGKGMKKTRARRIPKWKLKKQAGVAATDQMHVDNKAAEDPEQAKKKEAIDKITEAADQLLNRDYPEIYDMERERLVREYRAETGEQWVDPLPEEDGGAAETRTWEYRWTDGRDDGKIQGPYDGSTMKAWQDAGYFGKGIEFRPAGGEDNWQAEISFA